MFHSPLVQRVSFISMKQERKQHCLAFILWIENRTGPSHILPFSETPLMELEEIDGGEEMEEEEEEESQEIDEFLEEEEEVEEEEEEMDEEETSEESPASSPEWSVTEAQESPETIADVSDEEEDEDGDGSFEDGEFQSSSESEGTASVMKVTN